MKYVAESPVISKFDCSATLNDFFFFPAHTDMTPDVKSLKTDKYKKWKVENSSKGMKQTIKRYYSNNREYKRIKAEAFHEGMILKIYLKK